MLVIYLYRHLLCCFASIEMSLTVTVVVVWLVSVCRWICIYTAYINSKKTLAEGRRVPKHKVRGRLTFNTLLNSDNSNFRLYRGCTLVPATSHYKRREKASDLLNTAISKSRLYRARSTTLACPRSRLCRNQHVLLMLVVWQCSAGGCQLVLRCLAGAGE